MQGEERGRKESSRSRSRSKKKKDSIAPPPPPPPPPHRSMAFPALSFLRPFSFPPSLYLRIPHLVLMDVEPPALLRLERLPDDRRAGSGGGGTLGAGHGGEGGGEHRFF